MGGKTWGHISGATDSNAAFTYQARKPGGGPQLLEQLCHKGISRNRINDPTGCIYCHRHPDGYWLPGGPKCR